MRHEELVRKDLMGCASLHPSYGFAPILRVFSWFGVSLRDMKCCGVGHASDERFETLMVPERRVGGK
ncbi:MAG: hypothetical protein ACLQBD_04620 [Syntrophobacteraceae bacterium]